MKISIYRIAILFCLAGVAGAALAAFPQTAPNDPGYADQYGLKGGINHIEYPLATDAAGASGMSVDKAWANTADWGDASTGRPDVVIAYIEGGINYNAANQHELIPKVYLNRAEIESSKKYNAKQYVDNGDPWYNALDFGTPDATNPNIARPRDGGVPDANDNGYIDPEDLIVFYSDGADDDHNGYTDDISGWDFYDGQNNPNNQDVTYDHHNSQMQAAAALTNNGAARAGACPRCMLLPIRGGNEALDTPDDLAQAFIFAVDSGAKVITSLTADLGYNSFMRAAQEYAWDHDVLVAESTNDFDSTDHQGGMYWPHAIGGNGVIRNADGLDTITGLLGLPSPVDLSKTATYTFRQRSGQTSWGAKHMVSVAGTPSTSASTGTLGGILGLLYSYALEARDRGYVDQPLGASQIIQLMIHSTDDIKPSDYAPALSNVPLLGNLIGGLLTDTPLVDVPVLEPWPTQSGWDLQTGYGRIDVKAYQDALKNDQIPPAVSFDRPQWFSLYDPERTDSVAISGHIAASEGRAADWTLEYGIGAEPEEWTTLNSGSVSDSRDGQLGDLDLSAVPESFYNAAFSLSKRKQLETNEQYTVTLRLRATDSDGNQAEERRAIAVQHDHSWMAHFPRRIRPTADCGDNLAYCYSPGGEGQPALVDLQGLGHLQIVFGDTDGLVHVIDPATGDERPGFPVATDAKQVERDPDGVNVEHEPLANNVAVGDLDHNGNLWIVAASNADGKLYAWDSRGRLRNGFPITVATGVKPLESPRIPREYSRLPHRGLFASPELYDWDGDGTLEIVQAGWDGHIHVYRNDASGEMPGFPVEVKLPDSYTPADGDVVIQDHKLDSNPVIANLDDDPEPEIVVRTQFSDTPGKGIQLGGTGHLLAYDHDGSLIPGWPTDMGSIAFYYDSAQEFITEGSNSPVAADIDGDGTDEVAASPVFSANTYVFNGDGSTFNKAFGVPGLKLDPAYPLVDEPATFTTSGAFGRFGAGDKLSFAQSGSAAASIITGLLTTGLGEPIKNRETAYYAKSGVRRPGFDAKRQGLDFLGSPLFADVTGDGNAEIIDGGDSSAMHAYTSLGTQAKDFPKFMTGWTLWAPSVADLDGDGTVELVANTREGYTFVWHTPGLASANRQWWHFHHDEWNTGNYATDSRPPGILRKAQVNSKTRTLTFTAPGDNWYSGEVAGYRVVTPDGKSQTMTAGARAGEQASITVAQNTSRFMIQAVDGAGNLGRAMRVDVASGETGDGGDTPPPAPNGDGDGDGGNANGADSGNGNGVGGNVNPASRRLRVGHGAGGCSMGDGRDASLLLLLVGAMMTGAWRCRRRRASII